MPQQQKYQWLQCGRGIAALFVLLFHFIPQLERYGTDIYLSPIFSWGYWGVDIFFVLSGFVIALSTEKLKGVTAGLKFIKKRLLRIYLGYWPVLLLSFIVLGAISPVQDYSAFSNIFLTSSRIASYFMGVSWSLYFELTFYLFFCVLITFLPQKYRYKVIAILALVILIDNIYWVTQHADIFSGADPLNNTHIMSAYNIEFFFGVFLFKYRSLLVFKPSLILILISIMLISLYLGQYYDKFNTIIILRVFTFGVAALASVALLLCLEKRYSAPNWLVSIGDASYSLYLTHAIPINLISSFVFKEIGYHQFLGQFLIYSIPIVAIAFSLLWYRFIEHKLYLYASKKY